MRPSHRHTAFPSATLLSVALLLAAGLSARGSEQVPRRVLGADNGQTAIVNDRGELLWRAPIGGSTHDIQMLPNGNVLVTSNPRTVVELDQAGQVVWQFECRSISPTGGPVEVHAFQRLSNGRTMIAETGNRRIIEVSPEGTILKEVPLKVDRPDPHRDTRLVRKLRNGNYLVCHEGDGVVREYDGTGKVVWSYALDLNGRPRSPGHGPEGHGTEVFGAVRLANGNTLIAGGNNNRVLEVDPTGKIVWSIDQKELPGITLAWVTTLEVLPNGNLIFGNCHAGPENPQLIEVTRDKKVVWTLKDFKTFGNSLAAAQVLDLKGRVIR